MFNFLGKLLDRNEKEISRYRKIVDVINSHEAAAKKLKAGDLPAARLPDGQGRQDFAKKTAEFKERLSRGQTLDDLLPETFALVREAAHRTIGQRHFDVQMMAAITLHTGKVAEQKTGEGKTP